LICSSLQLSMTSKRKPASTIMWVFGMTRIGFGCLSDANNPKNSESSGNSEENSLNTVSIDLNSNSVGSDLRTYIRPLDGYSWKEDEVCFFGYFLEKLRLYAVGLQVCDSMGLSQDRSGFLTLSAFISLLQTPLHPKIHHSI